MQDVVVVGGGPVGCITALGLARAGVRVTLLEAEPQLVDSPRAAVYHWSLLDGLEQLGLLDEAKAGGVCKQDYLYLLRETGERIDFSMDVLASETAHPYNLHLSQYRLTELALRRLRACTGATVRLGTRLDGLQQDATGVTLGVTGPDGPDSLRTRWLVGADGAGSTVRRLLGMPFDGMTWPERFVATNVRYDFEHRGYGRATFVVDARFGAVIVVIDDAGLWRVTYMEDGALPEADVRERVAAHYREILPGAGDYVLEGASPYRMHQRSAPQYRAGRALLAGDAAHVTNPTGALGLATGLFDSYALYPALAAVVLEGADEAVLDRYASARRAVFVDRASPQAIANKRLIFHANGGGAGLDEARALLRRVQSDADVRRERLLFTRSLATPSLLSGASGRAPT